MIRTITSKITMIHKLLRITGLAAVLWAVAGSQAPAQVFDDSGNAGLNGDYFVREVLLNNIDQSTSDVGRALSIVGIMTFDGVGNYSFSGQIMDTDAGTVQAYSTTGSYALASNGMVFIQDLIDPNQSAFGGTGVIGPTAIVASATEGVDKNILVAIPAGSPTTNASVAGTYNAAFLDFLQGLPSRVRDGNFALSTSGNGSFGDITVVGSMANQGSVDTTQNLSGVLYDITNPDGSGTLTFPTAAAPLSALVSGEKTFYISADGNLILAGDPAGFDLIVGIRANSGAAANSLYQGTYYTGGLENDGSNSGHGQNGIDAFSGSIYAYGEGTAISHLRLATFDSNFAIDYTYEPSPYDVTSDGTFTDGSLFGMLGADGQALLEVGTGNFFSLTLGLWAGEFSGSGVLLDPLKVWNAASFAPITNSVAPGQFVSLFGSGLSSTSEGAGSLPLPTDLGNVQVTVNGVLAPISYVSQNQINALVPYSTSGGFATFQVINNGVASNPVTLYQSATAPGVFTSTQGGFKPGLGQAAAQHVNFSAVTQSNPAKVGETLQLYVTGLGSVTPAVDDGFAAPGNPPSTVDADVGVFVDGVAAQVTFKGLTPGLAGLYQVNFVVPNVASGLVYLAISTPDAFTTLAKLYIK
jgi:uncharacterized protein (TIGR03437 family)